MPNRILRDWTASEKVDKLSPGAEVFFTRLIMKADDFGLYWGNPKLLNSAIFPLKDYENSVVLKWLDECVKGGLIVRYKVDGKDYIQILGFDQRLRLMKSKFPSPPEIAEIHTPSDDCQMTVKCPPETRNETESETETEVETEKKPETNAAQLFVWPTFEDFWELYDKKKGRKSAEAKWKKITQGAREKIIEHVPRYVESTPDITFRKDPATYLHQECWNDQIIIKNGNQQQTSTLPGNIQNLLRARRSDGIDGKSFGAR